MNSLRENLTLSFERIQFFSDAVFAIAITLLIIEVKVPHIPHEAFSEAALGHALVEMLPKFAGFFFSFFVIGLMWIEHHRIFQYIGNYDLGLIGRNLLFLLFVAFIPFPTALFSEYFTSQTAFVMYVAGFALAATAKAFIWRYAAAKREEMTRCRDRRQNDPRDRVEVLGRTDRLCNRYRTVLCHRPVRRICVPADTAGCQPARPCGQGEGGLKYKLLSFARRVGLMLLVIWTVVSLVTLLIEIVPGEPATVILGETATREQIDNFNARHGLDKPSFFVSYSGETGLVWNGLDNRYADYWLGLLRGDLGRSFQSDRSVSELIMERYPATIKLAIAAMLVAIGIALPLGVLAGSRQNSLVDNFASVFALLGISLPTFVVGPFLVYIFAVRLGVFSPTGSLYPEDIVLPAVTLGAALSAILTRMIRSSVIEELGEDYVRTARAKGVSERMVLYKHVLKNGLIPVVTILGLQLGVLLAGAIITERIFNWQGLGLLLLEDGIGKRDYRLVQGCVLVISVTFIIANSLTDLLYRKLDPRIRLN